MAPSTIRKSWEMEPMVFIDTFRELVKGFDEQIENDKIMNEHEKTLFCVKQSVRALCFPYSGKDDLTLKEIHDLSKELTDKLIMYESTGAIEF